MKRVISLIFGCILMNCIFAQTKYGTRNWDLFKYSGPGLKQISWLVSKHSKEIKSSTWWSIGCESLDRDYQKFSSYKDYVGEIGVKRARLQSGWAKCEKVKGNYNFEWLDSCVYGLYEQGIVPWITLSYGNPIYNSGFELAAKLFTDENTMIAWLNYIEATVTHYKNVVKEWEIWNEPNSSNQACIYADLLIKTSEIIKKVQPEAKIIGFSLAQIDLKWAEELFEILKSNNKLGLVDYLTYHPYEYNPDDSYFQVDKLRSLVNTYNPEIKLMQGENGCPSDNNSSISLANYNWTEVSQAKWYLRRMIGDRIRNIPSSVFTITEVRYPDRLLTMGLLKSNLKMEVVYKKPAFYGVQHVAGFFDDSVEALGILNHHLSSWWDRYRKLTVAGFKKEGSPVVLIWYSDQIPDNDLKWNIINLTIKDINFKDPVYVEMISGKVFEIGSPDWENKSSDVFFKNLPVWDSVIMIAERSQVELKN